VNNKFEGVLNEKRLVYLIRLWKAILCDALLSVKTFQIFSIINNHIPCHIKLRREMLLMLPWINDKQVLQEMWKAIQIQRIVEKKKI